MPSIKVHRVTSGTHTGSALAQGKPQGPVHSLASSRHSEVRPEGHLAEVSTGTRRRGKDLEGIFGEYI